MRLKKLLLAGGLLSICSTAWAGQGEVCLADTQNTPAGIMRPFDDGTVFRCKVAGAVTVSELYAKGWRVVSIFPQSSLDPAKPGVVSVIWTAVEEKV